MALPERASSFPLGFSPFSQNDCLGTLLLNKKEVAIIMQSVASSSFNVKKKKNIQRGKLISCPFLWLKYNCNAVLEKEREKKRNFLWFYSPKWCMPLYLLKYLLNALNIAGRNWKWNDIWTLLHLDKDINPCLEVHFFLI